MKLKRYLDFIKESVDNEIELLWKHKEEDFKWYLTEFTDNEYTIDFHTKFIIECQKNIGSWSKPQYKSTYGITEVLMLSDIRPCYIIQITETPDAPGGDLTESLYFTKAVIESEMGMNCEIMINDERYDEWSNYEILEDDSIKIEDGEITKDGVEYDNICIVCWYENPIKISNEKIFEYYNWDKDEKCSDGNPKIQFSKKSGIWVRIDQDDLSGIVDWRGSDMALSNLLDGVDIYHSDFIPDTDSVVRYYLNDDARSALVKFLIKEAGGLDTFIEEIETNLDLEGLTEEKVINDILEESYLRTLVSATDLFGGDTWDDIRRDYQSWDDQSVADKYDNALQSAFDDKLGENFEFQKEEYKSDFKVGTKYYSLYYYWILLEDKFIDELVRDHDYMESDIKGIGADRLPMEWFGRCGETTKLYVSDQYGDVDTDEFSKEIISQYLS